ncbi:MAG: hypothetical protein AAF847_01300, partial [Bacteroidota bacterium]
MITFKHALKLYGGFAGTNSNVNEDPLFLNATNGDFRITSTSPAIDAGNDATLIDIATDLNSNPRIARC